MTIEDRVRVSRQMRRIRTTVTNIDPEFLVAFKSQPIDKIVPEFDVETNSGSKLIEGSGRLCLEDLEGWSDDELSERLNALSRDRLHS